MGKYRITDPSGSTFEITAPDGASESEIMSYAQKNIGSPQHIGGGQSPAPAPEPADARSMLKQASDYMSGLTDEALNTATFGMADKVKDLGGNWGTNAGNYIAGLINPDSKPVNPPQRSNEQRAEFREKNPVSSFVASMAGGGANPIAGKVGQYMGAGKSLPSQMARGSAGGAGLSATQAIGESDGPITERLKAGIEPAIVGAMVGPLVPAAIKGGAKFVEGAKNQLARLSPKMQLTQAARKMSEAMDADGFTPETALAELKRLGPDSTLADLGENTQALMYSVFAKSGPGSQTVSNFYKGRQFGRPNPKTGLQEGGNAERVEGAIDDLDFGKYHDRTALDKLQNEASELYKGAYAGNQVIDHPVINRILNTPDGRKAMQQARRSMNNEGKNLSMVDKELTAQAREGGVVTGKGVGDGLKLEYLDKVKKALYDLAEKERDSITGRMTDVGRSITEMRKQLTSALDEADSTGLYSQARKVSGGKLAAESAKRKGNNFISKSEFADEQTMADEIADMSAHELQNFRIGVANALKSRVGAKKFGGNATGAVKGNNALERKISVAFGDNATFLKFKNQLLAEDQLFKTYSKLTGSQTAKNLTSIDASNTDPGLIVQGLTTAGKGNLGGGVAQVTMGIKDKLLLPQDISNELAKILTGRNLTPIQQQYKAQIMSKLRQKGLSSELLGGSSGTIGSSGEPVNVRVDSNTRRSLANQLMQGR